MAAGATPASGTFASVSIESDGTAHGTSVKVNGVPIDGLTEATWSVRAGEMATATLTFELPAAHIKAREIILRSGVTSEDDA